MTADNRGITHGKRDNDD